MEKTEYILLKNHSSKTVNIRFVRMKLTAEYKVYSYNTTDKKEVVFTENNYNKANEIYLREIEKHGK